LPMFSSRSFINLALVNSKTIEIIPSIFSDHNEVRLDLNYKRNTIKNSNIWRLNNTLLNNQQITEEIKKEIKICIETNENENTTTQNLWDTVKAVLWGKFIAIQAYLKKQEKSQINNLTLHLKKLEKEEMKNPRVSRRKEILKIKAGALDVPAFAIRSPIVVGKLSKKNGLSLDEAAFVKEHSSLPVKVPIPGPYMLTRSAWFEGLSDKVYASPEALAVDVVAILREEVLALRDMGVEFIQFDEPILSQVVFGEESKETFMCAALPDRRDPTEELELAVRLMNETMEGVTGVRTGVHVCRGNWSRKEEVLLTGNYGPMLPYLMQMNVDQLVLECATPRAGEMEVFKEYGNEKEIGLGVVNPRTVELETTEQIVSRVKELLEYFDPEKIFLNPDCGFGTFAERNVNDADGAFKKLKVVAEAAAILRKEYA